MSDARNLHPGGNTYDKYTSANPITRALFRGFMNDLRDLLPELPGPSPRIVEVGCGEGHLLDLIYNHYGGRVSCIGYDLDPEVIGEARARYPQLRFDVGNVEDLALPEGSPDLLVCCEVLEHVDNPDRALERLASMRCEHFIFSVPKEPIWRVLNLLRMKYVRHLGNTPGHINHWSKRAFLNLIQNRFSIQSVRTPFPWTMALAKRKADDFGGG